VDVFASFFQVLHSAMVSRDRADRLWWVPSKKGVFKVKSFFSSLVGSKGRRFPWKSVWQIQAHSWAAFLAWTAALGKILTVDNLRKQKIIIVDRCYLCKRDGKLWTTFFFIVMWLPLCRIMFFLGLVCLELCLEELSIYLPVGGRLEGQGVLRFGRWCQFAFFGVFGRRKILGVSKTWRIPWRILLPRSFICCIFGRWPFCHPCRLSILIFCSFFFAFLGVSLCILSVYLDAS